MTDLVRQEVVSQANSVVVKVGTRVLTEASGRLDLERIEKIATAVARLRKDGRQVVLVSSGAVGSGMGELGVAARPNDIARLQAVAAVGQANLIDVYNRTFRRHGMHAGQVLLTAADLDDRSRYLNVRNTLLALMTFDAIPVVNENDTVAIEELVTTFGDNDRLAALVTTLLGATLLIILSDVDGLYDGDPDDPASRLISVVEEIGDAHRGFVQAHAPGLGKGGMASKLEAARMVTVVGGSVIVASGRTEGTLERIFNHERVGTLFLPQGKASSPRKRWLGLSATSKGRVSVDAGAAEAICQRGKSLLAIGIIHVEGEFEKGDVVSIHSSNGQLLGRGLTNYASGDIRRIQGLQSTMIAKTLGHIPYEEVVHRDNLLVMIRSS